MNFTYNYVFYNFLNYKIKTVIVNKCILWARQWAKCLVYVIYFVLTSLQYTFFYFLLITK